jgi:hypothetical protein
MQLSHEQYEFLMRQDLMSFIERSFYELNPQSLFVSSPHIEVMASRLEACRLGKTKRLRRFPTTPQLPRSQASCEGAGLPPSCRYYPHRGQSLWNSTHSRP